MLALAVLAGIGLVWWIHLRVAAADGESAEAGVAAEDSPFAERPPRVSLAPPPEVSAEVGTVAPGEPRTALGGLGATVVRVRLVDEAGAPVITGRLDCSWSLRKVEDDPEAGHATLEVTSSATELRMPAELNQVLVLASSDGFQPASGRKAWLRHVQGSRLPPGSVVEHDMVIRLGRSPSPDAISGTIYTDGAVYAPADLRILLEQPAGLDDPRRPGRQFAAIDHGRSLYTVGPVQADARQIWVTSAEIEPLCISIDPDHLRKRGSRLDLHCVRGRPVRIQVVDGDGVLSVAGLQVLCNLWVSDQAGRTRGYTFELVTDSLGSCMTPPLSDDRMMVEVRTADGRNVARVVDIASLPPERVLVFDIARSKDGFQLWGLRENLEQLVPGGAEDVAVVCEVPHPPESETMQAFGTRFEGDRWLALVLPDRPFRIWAVKGRQRVSETVSGVATRSLMDAPILLEPIVAGSTVVRIVNAPLGDELMLGYGSDPEPRITRRMDEESFEVPISPVHSGESIRITVRTASGDFVASTVDYRGEDEVAVDLCGDRRVRLRVELLGTTEVSPGKLFLVSLAHGSGLPLHARVETDSIGASAPLPLPGGRYYFWLDDGVAGRLVCGIADVPVGAAESPVVLQWSSREVPLPESPGGTLPRFLEVTHLGEQALAEAVSPVMRQIQLDLSREDRPREAPRLLIPPDSQFKWRY